MSGDKKAAPGAAGGQGLTLLMQQYLKMKGEIDPDVFLMFRLGDFYEMFFDDAIKASPILGVTLTKRNGYPMCGVPHHAIDSYLAKFIRANHKVAICEQMEDPATVKRGIVKRGITRVVTPGTVTEGDAMQDDRNFYVAALCKGGGAYGLSMMDLSTGAFYVEEYASANALRDSIARDEPRECLLAESDADDPAGELRRILCDAGVNCTTKSDDWRFSRDIARDELLRHFRVASLDGFGCESMGPAISAAGALLQYVSEKLHRPVDHVRGLRRRAHEGVMMLDSATCAHLDLLPADGKPASATLYGVLCATRTPMGARGLRQWISRPLSSVGGINARLDAVTALITRRDALSAAQNALSAARDLERLIGKVSSCRSNARDIAAVADSLARVPKLLGAIAPLDCEWISKLRDRLAPMPELVSRIKSTLADELPALITEGGMIRAGFSAELDELRSLAENGRGWIAKYQAEQAEKTGIKNLKVKHNSVFGYFIEVSNSQLSLVPAEYVRKQTIVGGERFITPVLKEYEEKIFSAHDESVRMESRFFEELRSAVAAETARIQGISDAMMALDIISAFADRALALGYCRPEITDGDELEIVDGRHPVVEQLPDAERFVPNDTKLDCRENQIMIITGPNMAGKSTYIRQVAVITVMAQIGSYVPAKSAKIGCVDRVFTRVGASDDLARGRSTFMVEMQETANILNNATPKSLVVLDEIGRGTSTFDGISIAWAVAEHLRGTPEVRARTLFATHYHELTDLALTANGIKNYCVLVREQKGSIAFLRRIVPGAADKSYGIAVAQLAGMPASVISRAKEILTNLEDNEMSESANGAATPKIAKSKKKPPAIHDGPQQMCLDL